jgi:hypothetical protein
MSSSSTTARALITATRLLRARFIDLQGTTSNIETVEFLDGFGRIIFRSEFDEPEPSGSTGLPVGYDPRGTDLVAFLNKQLH